MTLTLRRRKRQQKIRARAGTDELDGIVLESSDVSGEAQENVRNSETYLSTQDGQRIPRSEIGREGRDDSVDGRGLALFASGEDLSKRVQQSIALDGLDQDYRTRVSMGRNDWTGRRTHICSRSIARLRESGSPCESGLWRQSRFPVDGADGGEFEHRTGSGSVSAPSQGGRSAATHVWKELQRRQGQSCG